MYRSAVEQNQVTFWVLAPQKFGAQKQRLRYCRVESVDTPEWIFQSFNTRHVSIGNKNYEENFSVLASNKIYGAKNYLFSTTLQLSGNFESQYLQRGTSEKQSGQRIGNYDESRISS